MIILADIFTKKKRSEIMSKIRSRNTVPEKLMVKLLKRNILGNFRRGDKIFGRPDFILPQKKIALFVDGKFWHGYKYEQTKDRLMPYWRKKISDNIKRDKRVNNTLKREGWKVIRLWDFQVIKDPKACLEKIGKAVKA